MSSIDGPGSVGGSKPAAPSAVDGPRRAEDEAWVEGAEAAAPVDAAWAALFDQVAAELQAGRFASRDDAVRAAVAQVLEQTMPTLDASTRTTLTEQVSAALVDHPAMVDRLERLLPAAGGDR